MIHRALTLISTITTATLSALLPSVAGKFKRISTE